MENCLIREQMVRRPENEKVYTQLSTDVEVALAMKALSDASSIPTRMDRAEGRLQRHFSRVFDQLMKLKNNPPADGTQPESDAANENLRSESIPTNEHQVADELPPIDNAQSNTTVVMNTRNERSEPFPEIEHPAAGLKPLVMVAGASEPLATELATRHATLATAQEPLATIGHQNSGRLL